MELKEIEKQIQLITGCSSLESGTIMIFIESYGKEQYNQALVDAANRAEICLHKDGERPYSVKIHEPNHRTSIYVDKQSILNLKKH